MTGAPRDGPPAGLPPRGGVRALGLALLLATAGCAPMLPRPPAEPPRAEFAPVAFDDLPGWREDAHAEALPALARSCAALARAGFAVPPSAAPARSAAEWRAACAGLPPRGAGDDAARRWIEARFSPYRVTAGGSAEGLFTGYYEPELRGARAPGGRFATPLYRRPRDLVHVELGDWRDGLRGQRIAGRVEDGRLRPYASRAEIAAGGLAGRAEPLVWLEDEIDAFFLHIQGSGRVVLPDGSALRVGYDGQNGHPYVPIGRPLVAAGELRLEEVSLQSIRAWLRANPARRAETLNRNPSYIFFREVEGEGPVGAQGAVLTPGRSLAVDRTVLPLGAPVWLSIGGDGGTGRPLRRLAVAQDVGGAIRGAVRGDLFRGHGAAAEALAGPMRARGRWFVLLPRPAGGG